MRGFQRVVKLSRYNVVAELDGTTGVFSGLTGKFTALKTSDWQRVQRFVARSDDGVGIEETLKSLVEQRALLSVEHDELNELRNRYDNSRWRSGTLGYTVVTSLGCNFDCPYCFESKHPSLLKEPVADKLVSILRESLSTIHGLSVTWMGGEPLMGLEQLLALSDRFIDVCDREQKNYSASVITNGWYLTADVAKQLAQRRVRSAQVTIDGPPEVHDLTRPHRNGGSTFWRILDNVVAASEHIDVNIRINVDTSNADRIPDLLQILEDAGLAGKVAIGLGRITDATGDATSPLASYANRCMNLGEFGDYELAFTKLAESHGFGFPQLPRSIQTPCTAVRASEIVVGSDGEMWKCWDDIGNPDTVLGTVFDYASTNQELTQWLEYHPADDPQCSTCIAMPGCMGGCVHHDFNSDDREARCGSFRHNHEARVFEHLYRFLGHEVGPPPVLPSFAPPEPAAVPVSLSTKRRPATV